MSLTLEINGVDKTGLLNVNSLSVSLQSDHIRSCNFTLITEASTYLPKVGQDIKVKIDGNVKFGGTLKTISISGFGSKKKARCTSDGYNHIPARRTITSSWDATTAGAIVSGLITEHLATEGITAGTINTGATINEYDAVVSSIKDVFDYVAEASGFKWYINDSKQLNFLQEDTVVNAAHDIIYNGTFKDYNIVDYSESLENYANKQFVRGGLGDDGYIVKTSVDDSTEISARATIEGGSGVYGDIINNSAIETSTDATTAANNGIKKKSIIPGTLIFESYSQEWVPGTKLKVNLPEYGIATDTYFLIENVEYEDDSVDAIKFTITATKRKASDFSTQRTANYKDYFGNIIKTATKALNKADNVALLADQRAAANPKKIWTGTQAQYDAITTKDANTLYYLS